MDYLSGLTKGGDSKKPTAGEEKPSSTTDLYASAKVVAEAAKAPEKCDKDKTAGAAADLLDAASEYGKLDESKGVGKYVDQAEGYLRQYSGPKSTPAAAPAPTSGEEKPAPTTTTTHAAAPEAEIPSGGGAGDYAKKAEEFLSKPSEASGEAGGAGEYVKKAEEFLSKPSDGGEKGESESGYGGVMKAAGGFFK